MPDEHPHRPSAPDACRQLAAYLTGSEARQLADRLADGWPNAKALEACPAPRRPRVRALLDAAGLIADRDLAVAVLRAVEGAHSGVASVGTVWTAPGNLAHSGQLTASVHHFVTRARESVICSTFNFQRSSALWAALTEVAARPEVTVRIYLDTAAADRTPARWKPTTAEVARALPQAIVLRTKEFDGQLVRNHAKFVAVDHQYLVVTSANFSKSAERHNVELDLVITDPIVAQAVEGQLAALERAIYERVPVA